MQCTKCGEEFAASQSFCPFCGAISSVIPKKVKRSATAYVTPAFEICETDTVYENPNKAYDNKADEFYRPHSLPHSSRSGSKRHRRHRRKQNRRLRIALSIIAISFFLASSYFALKITSIYRSEVNIKGRWIATADSGTAAGYVYTFTNDGFVTVKKSEYESSQNGTKYCWRVEGNKLIVDDTTYLWSTDLNEYSDPTEEHWCVSGNSIYISNTHDDGFKVLEKNS